MVFKVLRFGPIRFAQESWDAFAALQDVEVVESDAQKREDFIKEIKDGKFADVDFIARTFHSTAITGRYDREVLELFVKHTKVKGIAHCGAGYDQIDAVVAGELGIQVANVPDHVADATADTNLFLILATMRKYQQSNRGMLAGKWPTDFTCGVPVGRSIQGKVVGILGMGSIGRTVRDRLSGFGVKKVVYYNRSRLSPELEKDSEYCATIEELAKICDVISINLPLNKHTHHIIGEDLFAQMKDGVFIVNTARGSVVDEAAMKKALDSGKVAGYGSDVWENEPRCDDELIQRDDVACLPHVGAATVETFTGMEEHVLNNVKHAKDTGKVLTIVPELRGMF